jgi:hypothetical protein
MLRESVERSLLEDHAHDGALLPAHGDYCFANVPDTLRSLCGLTVDRPLPDDVFSGVDTDAERVVVVLLDGFGYAHWKRDHADHPFLASLTEAGPVTPLTSTYPSETAAAMTTFTSWLQPIEHGVLGWWQYLPEIDRVIQTLPWTTLDDESLPDRIERDELFPAVSVHEEIADSGADVSLVRPVEIAEVDAEDRIDRRPYRTVAGMALSIRQALESGSEFVYAYSPVLDGVAHESGTGSEGFAEQLASVVAALERELRETLDPTLANETLLVVTADHGQIDTDPGENVDLRELPIWDHLRRNGAGEPIPPVGGPRNVRFHVRDGHLDRLRGVLDTHLDGHLFTRDESLSLGLFGDRDPHPEFAERCGELVCVPRAGSAWWSDDELDLVGMHGGLSPEEMLVPFAAARLDRLGP